MDKQAPRDLNQFLAGIYQQLRSQQEALFDLHMKIQALETALNTNQSFAELHEQATQHVRTDELIRAHEAALHALDALIDRLKGGTGMAEA